MLTDLRFWKNKRVCVTGGTGFLGWQIVRQLLPLAGHVRIFGLPPRTSPLAEQLKPLDCRWGDVRDFTTVERAIADCNLVFHAAGPVGVWGKNLRETYAIHVDGTRNVLQGLPAGARLIHTSSIVAVGGSRRPVEFAESAICAPKWENIKYVRSKKAAEDLVLAAAEEGADAVVVNPGLLMGPEDYALSPLGRFCLRFWRGRLPFIPPTGFNVVDVRDAACGHLLAAQHGRSGQRYILGGENLTWMEICQLLAEIGQRRPRWYVRVPFWLEYLLACCSELRSKLVRHEPFVSIQAARLNRFYWYCVSQRARSELGYNARPIRQTIADTFDWLSELGHFEPRILSIDEQSSQPPDALAA